MDKDFSAEIITLNEVYEISHELSKQITETSDSFDYIIAIARGGATPARLLCDFLNIDHMTSLQIRHYGSGAEEKEQAEIIDPVDVDLTGKKVLVVDDVNDSGKTLEKAVEHVQKFDPKHISTAVLHEKKTTNFETDFKGETLEDWQWLIYQWAATEDVLEFLRKDKMLDASEEKALGHLAEKYDLEVDKDIFQKVLEMRENYG